MSRRRVQVAVAALLVIQGLLLVRASRANFVTADEPGHFAAGIAAWRHGGFDLYRVNPPLPRMLAVVPVLALGVAEDYTRWHPDLPGGREERQVGQDVAAANAGQYLALIRVARLFTVAVTLLGGWIVFAWARALFGARAGLLALAVWCVEPNVLAHGCLVTPDMPCAVAGLAAMWGLWQVIERPSWRRVIAAGALLGVALLTKFTNLYLVAVWPVLVWIARRRAAAEHRPLVTARHALAIAATALVVVNAGYGCAGTLRPLGGLAFASAELAGDTPRRVPGTASEPTGNRFGDSWFGALPVPVPAAYVEGLDLQRHDFQRHFRSYLGGEWRDRGWWYYYLFALAIKVPIGVLVLVIAGVYLVVRAREHRSIAVACVLVPIAVVTTLVSSQTGLNAHLRYVLPIFPFLAICAGRVGASRDRRLAVAAAALVAWSGVSVARVEPTPLAHFNELGGDPARADRHLLDSNLDWGQDVLALRAWLERHAPGVPLGLAYFGGADPQLVGLRYRLPPRDIPGLRFASAEQMAALGPRPGLYAISVNFLRGMAFEAPDGAGRWQAIEPGAFAYFRAFQPIAVAGYSIRIYCLDRDQASRARARLALPPLPPSTPDADCARISR